MSDISPIVSVIIPTFNRCGMLERALKSVLNQTLQDIEVIIVDNASIDGTQEFVRQFNDQRIRYIRLDTNRGAPVGRNTGINAARSSLIALLDDDDEWFNRKLELQVQKFQGSSSSVGLVYVGSEIFDEHKNKVVQSNLPVYSGDVYHQLLSGTILGSVSSVLVKRECFEKAGMFDEDLTSCQDWDMWLRIARHYEFDSVDQILARINMHGKQISTDFTALIPGRTRMVNKHMEEFREFPGIYVIHLKRLGKLHCLNGTWPQAMEWFKKAIGVRKPEIFKILAWLLLEYPFVSLFQMKNFKKYSP